MVLRFSFLRRMWPYLLAISVGLAVSAFSFNALNREALSKEKVKLPVAARDLPPYTLLQPQDVSWGSFPADLPGAVKAPTDAVGKVAVKAVSKDYPLRVNDLKNPDEMGVQLVSVNIDASRLGGACPGDLVDVYWVSGVGAALLARDARVVGVLDKNGQPIESQGLMAATVQTTAKTPAIVVLAIKPEEVQAIISGSVPNSTCIALAKKFRPGGEQGGANVGGQVNIAPQVVSKPAGASK